MLIGKISKESDECQNGKDELHVKWQILYRPPRFGRKPANEVPSALYSFQAFTIAPPALTSQQVIFMSRQRRGTGAFDVRCRPAEHYLGDCLSHSQGAPSVSNDGRLA